MKVLSIFGTRPEAIKMCPLVKKLAAEKEIESVVCLTGQHKELLDQVMSIFNIQADYNLNIMQECQTLTSVSVKILSELEGVLQQEKPDLVLVHGDTSTSFVAALAAYYQQIPVGHVEAGLRTYRKYYPFPEEMNRTLISHIADLHFAPTEENRQNLLKENVSENIFVTGNTVLDSMSETIKEDYIFHNEILNDIDFLNMRCMLMTAHRRENLGKAHHDIFDAVLDLLEKYNDICILFPMHPNPAVRDAAICKFKSESRVHLLEPLDMEDMHNVIARSYFILTDSGGLQEEAPFCKKPVLVLRNETERNEAIAAGTVMLAGTERERVYQMSATLLDDKSVYQKMMQAVNPYGDGHASERIVKHILEWYKQKNSGGVICEK